MPRQERKEEKEEEEERKRERERERERERKRERERGAKERKSKLSDYQLKHHPSLLLSQQPIPHTSH